MSAAVALAPLNANATHKSPARPCTFWLSQLPAKGQVHIGEATKLLRQMWTPSFQACVVNCPWKLETRRRQQPGHFFLFRARRRTMVSLDLADGTRSTIGGWIEEF